jgi:peptide deformylase
MAIRTIIRMGHPLLRETAQTVPPEAFNTPEMDELLNDLYDTMIESQGIGIAAPQIGVSLQIALINIPKDNPRYPDAPEQGLLTIINPEIEINDQTSQGFWEGCLSVPGLRGYVERPRSITVRYLTREGESAEIRADGFLATVFQHELDHLFGKLYVDHISDSKKLMYNEEFLQFHANAPALDD